MALYMLIFMSLLQVFASFFFDLGIRLFFWWKIEFMMMNWCTTQNFNSKGPLSMQLLTTCLPTTLFQATEFWPTLAFKSPRIMTLSTGCLILNCTEQSKIYLFFCRICLKIWGIYTEECSILLVIQWEVHRDNAIRLTCWQIFKLGSNGISDEEAHI